MTGSKLTKKDYTKTTLRAYFLQNGFNYSNYQGLGYALVMYPAFKKLYGDNPAKLAEELDNNCEFYNTNLTSYHLSLLFTWQWQKTEWNTMKFVVSKWH